MTKKYFFDTDKRTFTFNEEDALPLKTDGLESNTNPTTVYDLLHKEETNAKFFDKSGTYRQKVFISTKTKAKLQSEYSKIYRKKTKIKLENLLIEKQALESCIISLLDQPFSNLFKNIPLCLIEFKDLILPSNTSFDNVNNCHEYISHLEAQRQT